jgi:hypothetical protein
MHGLQVGSSAAHLVFAIGADHQVASFMCDWQGNDKQAKVVIGAPCVLCRSRGLTHHETGPSYSVCICQMQNVHRAMVSSRALEQNLHVQE